MRIGISTSGKVPALFLFYISSINRVNPEPDRIAMTMRHASLPLRAAPHFDRIECDFATFPSHFAS
jgi:hypothetical protein